MDYNILIATYFKKYLPDLALADKRREKIVGVVNLIAKEIDNNISDIFICNCKEKINNGSRKTDYPSIWLFGNKHLVECKNFLLNNNKFEINSYHTKNPIVLNKIYRFQ